MSHPAVAHESRCCTCLQRDRAVFEKDLSLSHPAVAHESRCCTCLQRDRAVFEKDLSLSHPAAVAHEKDLSRCCTCLQRDRAVFEKDFSLSHCHMPCRASRRIFRCRIPLLHTNPAVAHAFNVIVHYSRRICRCRIPLLHTNPAVAHASNVIVQYSRRILSLSHAVAHEFRCSHAFNVIVQYSRRICRCRIPLLHTNHRCCTCLQRDRAVFEKDFSLSHPAVAHESRCCTCLQRDRVAHAFNVREGFVVVASRCCTRIPLLHMPST